MENREQSTIGLYTIGIAALFLAGFLLLVVFGAQSYRNTVGAQNGNMQNRAVLAGITTAVRGFDARDAVSVSEDQVFGQVLNLSDGDSGYALRLYMADGALLEEYSRADAAPSPEAAQKLGDTRKFAVSLDHDLLQISTDAGTVLLHLRSEAGS